MRSKSTTQDELALRAGRNALDLEMIEKLRELGAHRVKIGDIEVEFAPELSAPPMMGAGTRREPEDESLEDFSKDLVKDMLRSSH